MPTVNAIFGLVMVVAALVIGVVAFYTNLKNTKGPKEQAFVRRNCILALGTLVLFFTLMYYIEPPWRYILLALYFFHLPIVTYRAATKRQLIRRMEELEAEHHEPMTG